MLRLSAAAKHRINRMIRWIVRPTVLWLSYSVLPRLGTLLMSLVLAIRIPGLTGVFPKWPPHTPREKTTRPVLTLDRNETVETLKGMGYATPDGLLAYSARDAIEDALRISLPLRAERP